MIIVLHESTSKLGVDPDTVLTPYSLDLSFLGESAKQ
jgi:hypothetical protein